VVVLGPLSRRIKPFVLRVAGRRHVGSLAKVHHRGRNSGRDYATPVLARPSADGFLIPLFFGADADWCRNVVAAHQCRIEWHGTLHRMHNPRVLTAAAAKDRVRAGFPAHERLLLRLAGIYEFLVVDPE